MMQRSIIHRKEQGIAILESSFALIFLLSLVITISALVDYLTKGAELNAILDRVVYDSSASPLKLDFGAGSASSSVAHSELQALIQDMSVELEQELLRVAPDLSAADFMFEVGYSEIDIDPQSGASNGYRSFPFSFSQSGGFLSPPGSVMAKTMVEETLTKWEQLVGPSGAHPYSSPTAQFAHSGAANRYLSSIVILSARATVSLEGSFTGNSLELVGSAPYISSRKVILLRGDLSS